MTNLSHKEFEEEVSVRLAELLGVLPAELKFKNTGTRDSGVDFVASNGDQYFVVECKTSGEAAPVGLAARRLRQFVEEWKKGAIPLVAVPFMGEVGKRLCEEAGVSWFDLSGNGRIQAPGLRVQIEGKPNRFKRVGRPKSLFAPKSARITRWLLMEKNRDFSQRELAQLSGLDEGFTSRIVRGLEEQNLISRSKDGSIRVAHYETLLDAWREAYEFSKHRILRANMAIRSNDEALQRLSTALQGENIEHAATGLAGAWLLSGFAGFRLVVMYAAKLPSAALQKEMGLHEVPRGENVWIVRPNDCGVLQGSEAVGGIICAHPVQVYMDLKNHPERAKEAAEELRKKFLTPSLQ